MIASWTSKHIPINVRCVREKFFLSFSLSFILAFSSLSFTFFRRLLFFFCTRCSSFSKCVQDVGNRGRGVRYNFSGDFLVSTRIEFLSFTFHSSGSRTLFFFIDFHLPLPLALVKASRSAHFTSSSLSLSHSLTLFGLFSSRLDSLHE